LVHLLLFFSSITPEEIKINKKSSLKIQKYIDNISLMNYDVHVRYKQKAGKTGYSDRAVHK